MLTWAKLLRSFLWRGTSLSHNHEADLRNAFLHKYPLDNDAPGNPLYSFLHFHSRTGIWCMSSNENDLLKPINKGKKKSFDTFSTLKLSGLRWQEVLHLSHRRWLCDLWQSAVWHFFWWLEKAGCADTLPESDSWWFASTKDLIVAVQIS